uniref:Uncharacterized protein n=1 Tax=Meloidogyne javanica TaxID=6303 RepID=A0A915M076_MELJA
MSSKIPQDDKSSDEAVQLFRCVKYRMSQIKRLYNEIDTVEQMLEDEKVLRLRQSRLQFEEFRKEMDKLFESFKTSNNFKTFLQHINCCTLAVSFALQNQPTDEHFRYITSFACQKLIYVLEEARRLFAAKENDEEEDAQINKRRRKKKESW